MKAAEKLMIIENEVKKFRKLLGMAADKIRDNDVSDYPIFVVHKQEIALGVPIIEREKVQSNWSVNASSLEEFATKNLIYDNKIEEFKKTYKDPGNFLCLFILSDLGAQFAFIPRRG